MIPNSQTQKTLKNKWPESIFYFLLYSFLLISIITLFVPLSPAMLDLSFDELHLDESWEFSLNQALAQHLEFGKDIIFTFGPYSFLYSSEYHPATDSMMFMTSLYLACSYFGCFLLISKGTRPLWSILFCIGFVFIMVLRDSLLLSYPLLLGLAIFKVVTSEGDAPYKKKWDLFQVIFLFFPLGLLVLIKGTMLILSASVATLCFLFLIIHKKYYLAIAGFLSLLISTLFFWWLAGQPISNLPDFFINMLPIIFGYSEAMQKTGDTIYIILFIFPATFLLLSILSETKCEKISKLFLFFLYLLYLFFAFKVSFVLHNIHALMAGSALIVGALLLPFIFQSRLTMLTICFSVACGVYITQHYTQKITQYYTVYSVEDKIKLGIFERIGFLLPVAWSGFARRLQDNGSFQHNFEAAVHTVKKQMPFPRLEGTTDIYSWNQMGLIASGNTWSPRPVFQSYTVYTKSLALKNRDYLLGNKAPDNIIFKIETLRNNLPSLEDGASWPVLLSRYQPVQMENGYLILRKRKTWVKPEKGAKYESKVESFGKNVEVPHSNQLMYVTLDIHPTFLGWLAGIVFKSSRLHITLTLKSGEVKTYHMVSGMAKAGFLISPLVKDTKDFSDLYEKTNLDKDRVHYFSIEGNNIFWNDKYTVTFSEDDI